jgi:hypothetical protein
MEPEDIAQAEAEKEKTAATVSALFDQYDADGSGALDTTEVKALLLSQVGF